MRKFANLGFLIFKFFWTYCRQQVVLEVENRVKEGRRSTSIVLDRNLCLEILGVMLDDCEGKIAWVLFRRRDKEKFSVD